MNINLRKAFAFGAIILLSMTTISKSVMDCTTVTSLFATCSSYITYGAPNPRPGTPCCDAVLGLSYMADSEESKRSICGCMMSLITTSNPNATAIATLPGLCGIYLGFTIDPNTDCTK
ncbi:hypothetical protein ACHQM5_011337 [Ranunculus cassubicifolius]